MKLDQNECYSAVCAHDARYDGRFFTCVHTTGIFCRPICPARVPKRQNCLFVETASAASALGFRACKRCRPEVPAGSPAWQQTDTSLRRALRMIHAGALDEQPMDEFADRLGMGARHLRRLVKDGLGVSPNRLALVRRAAFARDLIESSNLPMTDIAGAAGFGSLRRFNDVIQHEFGASPTALRGATSPSPKSTLPKSTSLKSALPKSTLPKSTLPKSASLKSAAPLTLTLTAKGPLGWEALYSFFAARAAPGIELAENGRYSRVLRSLGGASIAAIEAVSPTSVRVELTGARVDDLFFITKRIRIALDLDTNLEKVVETLATDSRLAPLFAKHKWARLPGAWDPFELSVRALLGQQISVKAARTLAGRLSELFGQTVAPAITTEGLYRTFPSAEDISKAEVSQITKIGLTAARAHSVIALAKAAAEDANLFAPAPSLDALLMRFSTLPGIGPWTAHYIALRAFGETNAFPASDLGLRKAYGALTGEVPSAAALEKAAEAWAPWRGYAAQILWNSLP